MRNKMIPIVTAQFQKKISYSWILNTFYLKAKSSKDQLITRFPFHVDGIMHFLLWISLRDISSKLNPIKCYEQMKLTRSSRIKWKAWYFKRFDNRLKQEGGNYTTKVNPKVEISKVRKIWKWTRNQKLRVGADDGSN